MEGLDANHACIEVSIGFQKISQRLRRDIAAARERNMRMPRAQVRLQSGSERGFLHAFVDLEQMRMRLTHAYPNNFRSSFCGERPDTSNRQKEYTKLDCGEFFA